MKKFISNLKADIYSVFVKGNADNVQMARVFFMLAIPCNALLFAYSNVPL